MRGKNKRVCKRTSPRGGGKTGVQKRIQEVLGDREKRYGKKGEVRRREIMKGLKPVIETKSVKRSGRAQQVPKRVSESRGRYRACRWVQEAGRKRAKKIGCARKEGRRRELMRVYEELKAVESGKGRQGRKIQSEPRLIRDRRHKAAKANRVNVS